MPATRKRDTDAGATAVVVLGHGSRAAGAAGALKAIADRLGNSLDFPVRAASLQFNRPTLAECCRDLVSAGKKHVIIAPYFLFNGNHIRQDIPEEIEALSREFPEVEFTLAAGLGEDGRLADILEQRVLEAMDQSGVVDDRANAGGGILTGGAAGSGDPAAIEAQSFAIIDGLLDTADTADPAYQVVRRVVHATGDPGLATEIFISPGAIEAARASLVEGAQIICDVNMVAAGIQPTARRLDIGVHCGVAGDEATTLSREAGITRSAAAFRLYARDSGRAAGRGLIVAVGNAPTALYECLSLQHQGLWQPDLVVGVPVGFVGAAESKQELAESGLPHITIPGNRGGSSIAVAIVNALMRMNNTDNREE